MTTNAPTSADACLSIVHSLMCHRQVNNPGLIFIFKDRFLNGMQDCYVIREFPQMQGFVQLFISSTVFRFMGAPAE